MSDIALINSDIVASNFGDILVIDDNNDIVQTAINNILTVYGENQFHPNIGNMVYHTRYKMSENGLKEIANQCRNAIMLDHRVANVVEVVAANTSTIDNYGECRISFVLITVDGIQLSSDATVSVTF